MRMNILGKDAADETHYPLAIHQWTWLWGWGTSRNSEKIDFLKVKKKNKLKNVVEVLRPRAAPARQKVVIFFFEIATPWTQLFKFLGKFYKISRVFLRVVVADINRWRWLTVCSRVVEVGLVGVGWAAARWRRPHGRITFTIISNWNLVKQHVVRRRWLVKRRVGLGVGSIPCKVIPRTIHRAWKDKIESEYAMAMLLVVLMRKALCTSV